MVAFELKSRENGVIRYLYYPENRREKAGGIIELNTHEESIEVVQKAEGDMLRRVSVDQLNALRNDAAALRRENGEAELSEEEWPIATEPEEWYVYADHAMRRICEAYMKGNILEYGEVMWY